MVFRGPTEHSSNLKKIHLKLLITANLAVSACLHLTRACVCNVMCSSFRAISQQEAQLMLTTGSTRLAVSRGQQTWYHSTCYI